MGICVYVVFGTNGFVLFGRRVRMMVDLIDLSRTTNDWVGSSLTLGGAASFTCHQFDFEQLLSFRLTFITGM